MFEPAAEGYGLAGNRMAHAEMNALLALRAWEGDHPMSCTLYTTMEPCPMCIGAARMYMVGQVRYAARDPVAGSAPLAAATPFMARWPVEISGPQDSILESALLAVQADFLLRLGTRWARLAEEADPAFLPGVRLGRRLFASGELACLRADGVAVAEVLEWLVEELQQEA
jgi:hypothetical protein